MSYYGIPVSEEAAVIAPLKPYSYLGTLSISSSYTVQASDYGKIINITSPNVVLTLPASSATPGYLGVNIIYTATSGNSSVVTSGTDVILNQTSTVTSITFSPGDSILLVSNTSGAWWNISSTSQSISKDLSNNTDPTKGAALVGFAPGSNVYQQITNINSQLQTIGQSRLKQNIAASANNQVDFTVPNGYVLGELDVFMYNTYLVEGVDYTATDGSTVHLINPKIYNTVKIGDTMTVSALRTYSSVTNPVSSQSLISSGGATLVGYGTQTVKQALDTLNQVRTKYSIPATSAGQTSFTVPGGYLVGKIECFMFNAYLMDGIDIVATDGTTVTLVNSKIYSRIQVGDPLIVTALSVYAEGQNNVDKTTLASSAGASLVGYGGMTVKQALDLTIVNRQQQYYTGINSNTITVTGGYNPGSIEVYLNGGKIPFGSNIYQATDGQTVVFQHPLNSTDVVELLINSAFSYNNGVQASQLSSTQAGLGANMVGYWQGGNVSAALDALLGKPTFVQGTTTSNNQTVLPVTGGYTVGTVRSVVTNLGLSLMHGDFTATDGQNITITNPNITLPLGTVYEVEFYTPYVAMTQQINTAVATAQTAAIQAQNTIPPTMVVDYPSLRAYTGTVNNIFVTGYSASASPSKISGWFILDPIDTTTADNGGTVIVDTSNRRWKRAIFDGTVNPYWFGALGTGADDSAALTAALATGLKVILPKPSVAFGFKGTLTINQVLEGSGWGPSATLRTLDTTAKIRLNGLSQLKNLRIDGQNQTFPSAVVDAGIGQNRIFLKEVRVENVVGDCFQLTNTQNSVLHDCQANNFTGNGFRITGAENCGLNNCNTSQNSTSSAASRGILMEAYNGTTPPRNVKIKDGIYERGNSDYQVEILSAAGFISFINTEINVGTVAGIRWAARTDTTPSSGGQLRVLNDAFTLNGTDLAVDGSTSNLEYFLNGYIMSGTSGVTPLSLLSGKAKVNESRARTWFESSFEQDAEVWGPSGGQTVTWNSTNRTIDCTSTNNGNGAVGNLGTFYTSYSLTNRYLILEAIVSALSGASALAVTITTSGTPRYGVGTLNLGYNKIAIPLQTGDRSILIGASTAVATTFSLKWIKGDVV